MRTGPFALNDASYPTSYNIEIGRSARLPRLGSVIAPRQTSVVDEPYLVQGGCDANSSRRTGRSGRAVRRV
jgi:hypothetical protein